MGIVSRGGLTILDADLEKKRNATYPGMAHFAGTGPAGKTCRECIFWTGCGERVRYYAKGGVHGGVIRPQACAKYKELMREVGPAVPFTALACKYFAETATPFPITETRG